MPTCPELTDLEDLVAGRSASAELRLHVDSCDACRRRSEEIAADNEMLARIGGLPADPAPAARGSPEIDGYRVVAELHRGGQGIVYDGVQLSTGRRVALKVLLEGTLASPLQLLRFEREIEVVLRLRHENVVAVYDRGVTRDGRQFFAMEFVDGVPLDRFAQERRAAGWSERDAVLLFRKICGAVTCAHQRGVIHRDLKPGNVLVDRAGEPRVLDFGLAKAVADGTAPAPAAVTRPGWFLGTLAWAAPEQLRGDPDLIDVRGDVYSLGVMLFELVTGRFPYPVEGAMADVVRSILEVEPRLPAGIDGDLGAILRRALMKERDQRYPSAADFARDLERWLAGEPVDAQRGRLGYLLRKAIARHKVRFALAAGMVLLLAAAAIFSTISWRQASVDAERSRIDATTRSRVTQIVESMLLSLDPDRARGRTVTMREVLDDAVRRLDAGAREEPAIEAELRVTMGTIYGALGVPDAADAQFERALALERALHPEGHPSIAVALLHRADAAFVRADYDRAQALVEEATALLERLRAEETPAMSLAINELGRIRYGQGDFAGSERLHTRALAMRRAGEDPQTVAVTLVDLSNVEFEQHRGADAQTHLREALQIRRGLGETEAVSTASTLRALQRVLLRGEEFDEARACLEEAVRIDRRLFGERDVVTVADLIELAATVEEGEGYAAAADLHRQALEVRSVLDGRESLVAAYALNRFARLARASGDLEAADRELRASLSLYERLVGASHPSALAVRENLCWTLYLRARFAEAERVSREILELRQKSGAGEDWSEGMSPLDRAWIELEFGRFDEAERLARESLAVRNRLFGEEHGLTAKSRNALAWILHARGREDEAETLARENLERETVRFGESSPEVAQTLHNLARIVAARGRAEEAEELFGRAIELRRELHGDGSLELASSLDGFGWFLVEQRRLDEAKAPLEEALAIRRRRLTAGHPDLGWSLNNAGVLHFHQDEIDAAEQLIGEAVANAGGLAGGDHVGLGIWLGNLGTIKVRRKEPAAAAPLLLASHRILAATRGPFHPQTVSVERQLVDLFTSLGNAERAAEFSELVRKAGAPRPR